MLHPHQLARREWLLERRRTIAHRYTAAFGDTDAFETPPEPADCVHGWHLYMLRLRQDVLTIDRDRFIAELKDLQIGTSVHFIPLHLHPYYRDTFHLAPQDFPVALAQYQCEISLPIYPGMTDEDVDDVIAATSYLVSRYRR